MKRTFVQMIEAGCYDEVNPQITEEHFPIEEKDRSGYKLETIPLEEPMTRSGIDEMVKALGVEHADFADLCEHGEKNPEEQRTMTIIEFRSVWIQNSSLRGVVAILEGDESYRALTLDYEREEYRGPEDEWLVGCCVLVRRKNT